MVVLAREEDLGSAEGPFALFSVFRERGFRRFLLMPHKNRPHPRNDILSLDRPFLLPFCRVPARVLVVKGAMLYTTCCQVQ